MFDYVNAYLRRAKETYEPGDYRAAVVPQLRCPSGLTLSVQASRGHYCTPREQEGPWTTVEVLCRDRELTTLRRYRDVTGGALYCYVPVERLNRIIANAGGICQPFVVLPPPIVKPSRKRAKQSEEG